LPDTVKDRHQWIILTQGSGEKERGRERDVHLTEIFVTLISITRKTHVQRLQNLLSSLASV